MKRAAFESLLFVDVEDRAAPEPAPQPAQPRYFGRPWSQLRDEMIAKGASTVAELPAKTIESFYRSTESVNSATSIFKGLFSGKGRFSAQD
jgi:hypothetical protein